MSLHFLRAVPVRSIVLAAYANTVPSLLTPAQVCERLSIGDATLRRYAKNNPHFPRKVKLGPRRVAYVATEIENYIEAMKEPIPV
ncbi:AlpA family phage regulatory protein [Bradyrhizobium sp. F1.13.3]|uniref:helix-turn-helix transcriptional regulator n=1 Tax=Bradyrhizobium sp. F1.13.3 TaxID=3156351 RepID=UPI00339824A7